MTKEECKKLFMYVQDEYNLKYSKEELMNLLNDWFLNLKDIAYQRVVYALENYTYNIMPFEKPNSKWVLKQVDGWEEQKRLWGFKDKYAEEDLEKSKKELLELFGGNSNGSS